MELRQLEYLVAVIDDQSFTRAAERLHVAQPGVSAQVRRLEAELGQPLLDRSRRGRVVPTAAGRAILPHARAALAAIADVRTAVDEVSGLLRGHVRVGTVTATPFPELPNLLADFHAAHPGVEISLSEARSDALVAGVQQGDIDLALIGGDAPPDVATRLITEVELVAAAPAPLGETITFAKLVEHPLIALPQGTGVRASLDRACAHAGVTPRIAFEASDPLMLVRLAARGLGVAVVPPSAAEVLGDEVATSRIVRPALRARLQLAWRADGPTSPAARALIEAATTPRRAAPRARRSGSRSAGTT